MSCDYLIRLPWPPKILSRNVRAHWAEKARATKSARHTAWSLCKEAGVRLHDETVEIHFQYFPPNRYRRDAQNMPDMLKASIDGIADALGIDDHTFRVHYAPTFSEVTKGGAILAHIKPAKIRTDDDWQQIGDIAKRMTRGGV